MNTSHHLSALSLSLAGVLTATGAHAANFGTTVGVYDAPGQANGVDVNTVGANAFAVTVATAFAADLGGVIDFENVLNGDAISGTQHSVAYGASGANTLQFTTGSGTAQNGSTGSFQAISGDLALFQGSNQSSQLFTFNQGLVDEVLNTPIGGAPLITQVGYTLLSRLAAPGRGYPLDVRSTATFTDGSTPQVLTVSLTGVRGASDTFVSFLAPAGAGVASVNLESFETGTTTSVSTRIAIDDLGFVVPEPGSLALLTAGGLTLLARRRPQH